MAQDNWKDVKSKVEGLGLKLKLHLEQEDDDADNSATPGDTRAAVEELGDKLQDAFNSFGAAAKDPAVRSDVKEIGAMLKDAVFNTFSDVGAEVGENLKKAGDRVKDTMDRDGGDRDGGDRDGGAQDGDSGADAVDTTDGDSPSSEG